MIIVKKVLVVGYGSMGRRRIRLISQLLPDIKIICVDNNIDRKQQAIEDGHKAVSSLDEGINELPDVAFICTSPGHHAELILTLVKAGIHVFTELNLSSDKYQEINALGKSRNVTIFISSTLIYKRQMELFYEMVHKQSTPVAYIYHVGQYLPDWHPWESYKDFFVGKKETNGIREILAIQLPWIIESFGKIVRVNVINQNCTKLDIDFPDVVILSFMHENGNVGSFVVDVTSRKAVTELEIIGEDIHISWGGHNDDLYRYDFETKNRVPMVLYKTEEHMDGYSDNITEEPYREEIREFLSVIDGKKPRYGIEEDTYVLSLIDEIERKYMNY